jgi:hypothetical protein
MTDEKPMPDTTASSVVKVSTDDLEVELEKRQRRRERGWKLVVASALAAAITAWIPNVSRWIDAQAERARQEVIVSKIAKEQVANEEAYKKLSTVINQHTDELRHLQSCLVELATIKEWKKGVDERLSRRLRIPAPTSKVSSSRGESYKGADKISTERPAPEANDPKLQKAQQELKDKAL